MRLELVASAVFQEKSIPQGMTRRLICAATMLRGCIGRSRGLCWPVAGGGYDGHSIASVMRDLLVKFGVAESNIWMEERSTSTYENALYGAAILKKYAIRNIALVVDQRSMLRAEACFRKQGIEVVPAPDFRTQLEFGEVWMPAASVIARNELTVHETLGFVW